MLKEKYGILVSHWNLFSITIENQKGLQMISEGESLIFEKMIIRFDKKMKNNGGSGFLMMIKLIKNPGNCAILYLTINKHVGK